MSPQQPRKRRTASGAHASAASDPPASAVIASGSRGTSTLASTISTTTPSLPSSAPSVAQRQKKQPPGAMSPPDEERPLMDGPVPLNVEMPAAKPGWARRNQWILFALASGACAACNGVFAKLTTTELTASLSLAFARGLGLESVEKIIEILVRGTFFGLNLAFNGVMWSLFTTALAKGNSTTQVSIMNTSSNFVLTAILGSVIFSESLPPLWWLGAAMLVAGNVVVGRKDEGAPRGNDEGSDEVVALASASGAEGELEIFGVESEGQQVRRGSRRKKRKRKRMWLI